MVNSTLLLLIEKEVKKLYDGTLIVPLICYNLVSNLVPMRKKTREIRLCVDFKNLKKTSLKDKYPLPKMDHLLQMVFGLSRMSLLDGFSGYHQVMGHSHNQQKTTFTTAWGTFMYVKMPFGLMNVGVTFQMEMDLAFAHEIDRFIIIYLDDIIVFLKSEEEPLQYRRRFFEKCRKYGISLNPKKTLFCLEEGNLLSHIISKEAIRIDPSRVEVILRIDPPRNKK